MPTRRTGFVCHELYMWHNTGNYAGIMPYGNPVQPYEHAETPETKRRFRNLVEVSGMLRHLSVIEPREATEEEILRFHTREHLERVKMLSAGIGGDAGPAHAARDTLSFGMPCRAGYHTIPHGKRCI